MISKNFIRSSFIYTLAGALPMASAIILLPFYILYLPTEVYGAFGLCLAVSAFIQIVSAYSFDSSLYIHYHEFKDDQKKLGEFVSSAFVFILGLGAVVGIVLSLTGQLFFSLFLSQSSLSFYPYGFIAVGIGVFQAIFKVHGNLLQTREKPETFFWSNVLSFGVIAVTTIVGLKLFPGTLIGPLGGRLLSAFLAALWALFRVFKEFGFHVKSPWLNTSFSFNVFTFIYQLQQWVINYVDRFVILLFMPTAAMASVGLYEFAIKCLAPVELILNGTNASMLPQVIKLIKKQEGDKSATPEINRYFYGQISVMMLLICGAIITLPWAVDFFISKSEYAEALQYVPYLAIIFLLRAMRLYFVVPYNVLKMMNRLTAINLFVSFLKIGLTIVLVFKWQLYGVIVASGVSYGIEILLLQYYKRDFYKTKFNFVKLIISPMIIFFSVIILEPFLSENNYYHFAYGLLTIVLLWFSYRKELVLMANKLAKR